MVERQTHQRSHEGQLQTLCEVADSAIQKAPSELKETTSEGVGPDCTARSQDVAASAQLLQERARCTDDCADGDIAKEGTRASRLLADTGRGGATVTFGAKAWPNTTCLPIALDRRVLGYTAGRNSR